MKRCGSRSSLAWERRAVRVTPNIRLRAVKQANAGDLAASTEPKRSATVRADDDCYVMAIGKEVMGEVIRESPDCLKQLSEILAKRKMETEGILKDAAVSSADQAAKQREYTATFLRRLKPFFAL